LAGIDETPALSWRGRFLCAHVVPGGADGIDRRPDRQPHGSGRATGLHDGTEKQRAEAAWGSPATIGKDRPAAAARGSPVNMFSPVS